MLRKITALKARQNLGRVMNEVVLREDEYVVERAGKPLVAIVSINEYLRWQKGKKEAKKRFFQFVDKVHEHNKDVDSAVIERDIEEAIRTVRNQKS